MPVKLKYKSSLKKTKHNRVSNSSYFRVNHEREGGDLERREGNSSINNEKKEVNSGGLT